MSTKVKTKCCEENELRVDIKWKEIKKELKLANEAKTSPSRPRAICS